jgi:hypothetical protein
MRIRTVLGFAVLGIVSLACSGGDGPIDPTPVMCSYSGLTHLKKSDPLCVPPPPAPSPTIDITLNSNSGIVGDTLTGTATSTNSTSCTLTATGATLLTGTNCGPFKVVLTVVGTATVNGSATGAAGTQPALVSKNITVLPKPVVTMITFTGKIILLNAQPGDTPGGWNVFAEVTGEEKVSTTTLGDGSYVLPSVKEGQVRTAIITVIPPSGSRYGPLYLETSTVFASVNMQWPALPKSCWVMMKGIYAGECLFPDMNELLLPSTEDDGHFYQVEKISPSISPFGNYINPSWYYFGGYPQPFAIGRSLTTSPLNSQDSIKIWGPLDELKRITGFEYFRPSTESEVRALRHGVLFYIDSTITGRGAASGSGFLSDPNAITNNFAVITSVIVHDLDQLYRSDLQESFPRLIQHESIHCLGFNHTSIRLSLMSAGSYENYSYTLTAKDVLYLEIARELTLAQKTYNTRLGIAERLNGMYVVEQGRPPSTNRFLP